MKRIQKKSPAPAMSTVSGFCDVDDLVSEFGGEYCLALLMEDCVWSDDMLFDDCQIPLRQRTGRQDPSSCMWPQKPSISSSPSTDRQVGRRSGTRAGKPADRHKGCSKPAEHSCSLCSCNMAGSSLCSTGCAMSHSWNRSRSCNRRPSRGHYIRSGGSRLQ